MIDLHRLARCGRSRPWRAAVRLAARWRDMIVGRAWRAAPASDHAIARTDRPRVSTDQLLMELSDITAVADELGVVPERRQPEDGPDHSFDRLDSIRWSLANYVLRGDRTRRLVNAPNSLLVGKGDDRSHAALTLSARADALSDHIRQANVVIADWLVTHRVRAVNPCYLDSNVLLDRFRLGQLDQMAIAEDPLYLLVCHLQDVLEAAERAGDVNTAGLEYVEAQLTLPLQAVQQEVAAAIAYGKAALGLTYAADRT